ncbi:MAG TPA: hypothetical protein VER03_10155 [Bryobacteraceae bacterium]|nr:hypothetical protein [Bryobacteraceae bacterium]
MAFDEEQGASLAIPQDRMTYVGDGSLDGLTIAVSEKSYLTQIARRRGLSEDALRE